MKSGFLLALFLLLPSLALADIYKAVGADGHVTYSSSPIRGGKRVIESTATSEPRARATATPEDFPRVNSETQKGRDGTRRSILQDELKTEEILLGTAKESLRAGQTDAKLGKNSDKIKALVKQVELHQRNVEALNIELSRLK